MRPPLGLEQFAVGASCTWTLANHDSVRAATRFGLPPDPEQPSHIAAKAWVTADGKTPTLDATLGVRRARAGLLLELALPGSTYLYQGEELGLHEVADLPADVLQDPIAVRSGGAEKGRDGCRVPLPWTPTGSPFGFDPDGGHLYDAMLATLPGVQKLTSTLVMKNVAEHDLPLH